MTSKFIFAISADQFDEDEMYCLVGDLNSPKTTELPFTTTTPIFINNLAGMRVSGFKITYPNGQMCTFNYDNADRYSLKFTPAGTKIEAITTNGWGDVSYFDIVQIKD